MLKFFTQKLRARYLVFACVPVAGFLVLIFGLHLANRNRFDVETFEKKMDSMIERSQRLAERAADFDQDLAIEALGTNPINGPVYRFDAHWRNARLSGGEETSASADALSDKGVFLNFDDSDTHHFDPESSDFKIEDGVLKIRHQSEKNLKTVEPFEIPYDDAATVRFRMKLEQGERVEFAFARGMIPERRRFWEPQMGVVTTEVVPDGKFHTYEVDIGNLFQHDEYDGLKHVQRLFFSPSDIEGDNVEIDFIHILRRKARYLENPVGTSYESFDLETRPVLYMNTPRALIYEVDVPEAEPVLRFGLGMLDEDDPVTFSVSIEAGKNPKTLFRETRNRRDAWKDVEIPLENYAGQRVALTFSAESEKGNIAFWSNPELKGSSNRRFNVVILLEDTLRADHLSAYGYDRPTSPVKDRLAKEGVVFETAFAQATETRPSCPTLMTSLYPTSTGVYFFTHRLSERYLTLAEVMRSQGYETAAFVQNNFAGRVAGLHQGYSRFYERHFDLGGGPQVIYNERLDSWLDDHADENFFLYLHILDPHDPYEPKPPFDQWAEEPSRLNPGEPQKGFELDQSNYDGEILGNDAAFGEFVEDLKERGVYDDTLIVILSDHGEFFGEHGGMKGHRPPAYSQVIHIPLMMRYPGALPPGQRVKTPVGLIDVMPTILELGEINPDPLLLHGDSLLPIVEADPHSPDIQRMVITDDVRDMELRDPVGWGAILFGRWHLVNSRRFLHDYGKYPKPRVLPHAWIMQIFNYGKDPSEENQDLAFAVDPLMKQWVHDRLVQLQSTNVQVRERITRGEQAESSNDPETLERLRHLGYLE